MNRLTQVNSFLEKLMPLITPFSLLTGVLFAPFFEHLRILVPYLFALLTFSGSLGAGFGDMKKIIQNPLPILSILLLLHIWLPVTALMTGKLLFSSNPYFITGMVLEFSVPTAVVSMIWVLIHHGNAALSLSVLLIDTLLSPLLTPLTLKLLVGSSVAIDPVGMIRDLVLMIALPALLAMALNQFTNGRVKSSLSPKLAPFAKIFLMIVVMTNSSRVAPFFRSLTPQLLSVAAVMLALAAGGFLWGMILARLLKLKSNDMVSLVFGAGMRNISAGAVIAAQYFPAEVLFPVMICTVFQQILAALAGMVLRTIHIKMETAEKKP